MTQGRSVGLLPEGLVSVTGLLLSLSSRGGSARQWGSGVAVGGVSAELTALPSRREVFLAFLWWKLLLPRGV